MIRVLASEPLGDQPGRLVLSEDERHHLAVRRIAPGTPVEVLDGHGAIGVGAIGADQSVDLTRVVRVERPVAVSLLVGAGDKDRFGWLVEKCVEVGVTEIVPVETERSLQVATRLRDHHIEKLSRKGSEALKQCGGAWQIEIRPPTTLASALAACSATERWLADLSGELAERRALTESLAVAVGPEGGFTPAERQAIIDAGFAPIRLGIRTMRFETAGLAAGILARAQGRER
ncbi:MAG: RsmE family RNA methyltransferase [Gemmatimonadales bacterium]